MIGIEPTIPLQCYRGDNVAMESGEACGPRTTEDILREEAEAIHGRGKVLSATGKKLYPTLNGLNSAALCLSGGGIRSAAFALGVIQALATHPRPAKNGNVEEHRVVDKPENSLLAKFHYLSTVSGGGYIGGWLSAWLARANFASVWENLVKRPEGSEIEPQALAWLRTYSSYLTPKLGIMSADAWAAVVLYVRNLILNWFIILPALFALLIVLKFYAILTAWIGRYSPGSCTPLLALDNPTAVLGVAGLVLVFIALTVRTSNRPSRAHSWASQSLFLWFDLVPSVLGACLLVLALAPSCLHDLIRDMQLFDWSFTSVIAMGVAGGSALYGASWVFGRPRFRGWRDFVGDLFAWIMAGAIVGVLLAIGLYLARIAYDTQGLSFGPSEILFLVCGVPWILGAQLIGEMIFVGLTSWEEGSDAILTKRIPGENCTTQSLPIDALPLIQCSICARTSERRHSRASRAGAQRRREDNDPLTRLCRWHAPERAVLGSLVAMTNDGWTRLARAAGGPDAVAP
jgi:hypothetical protein